MHKHVLPGSLALAFCFFLNNAQAATVFLTTEMPNGQSTYTTSVDSFFDVKIMIQPDVPDLGSIAFTMTYEPSKLEALSLDSAYIFGQANTASVDGTPSWAGGTIQFAEAIAADSPLLAGISVTVPTLVATIHFKALALAQGDHAAIINPTDAVVSDFAGTTPSPYDIVGFTQGIVTINPAAPVPIPAAVWLFGSALAGLGCFGGRRKRS